MAEKNSKKQQMQVKPAENKKDWVPEGLGQTEQMGIPIMENSVSLTITPVALSNPVKKLQPKAKEGKIPQYLERGMN